MAKTFEIEICSNTSEIVEVEAGTLAEAERIALSETTIQDPYIFEAREMRM